VLMCLVLFIFYRSVPHDVVAKHYLSAHIADLLMGCEQVGSTHALALPRHSSCSVACASDELVDKLAICSWIC
jgi:hypothetical protein